MKTARALTLTLLLAVAAVMPIITVSSKPPRQSTPPAVPTHVPFKPFARRSTFPHYTYASRQPSIYAPAALIKPAGVDLDVTLISRDPMDHRYDVVYTPAGVPYLQPGTESDKRWPAPGELVTFTAHIANKGTVASGNFVFTWSIDGVEVRSGIHSSLAAGAQTTETYQWAWAHTLDGERLLGSHTVRLSVDPANVIHETYETNNSLEDRTDALSLVLAVTPVLYSALETPIDPKWPFSAEDWLQKQIVALNAALARSIYPTAPQGIVERVRLDTILIASSAPPADLSEDGMFFMEADDRSGNGYYDPVADVSGGLLHELTHQLGIIDLYNLDVPLDNLHVLDRNGWPVQMEYSLVTRGIMSDPGVVPPIYDEDTTLALNTNKGYRRGYYGEYLYDVPTETRLRILDNQGHPASGVAVSLYQRESDTGPYGTGLIDATPEITGVTGDDGVLVLSNRPAGASVTTRTGHTLHDNPFGPIDVVGRSAEFLVELNKGPHQEYVWLDITRLNLAFWHGDAAISIAAHVPVEAAPAPPAQLSGLLEQGQVKLQWQASPSIGIAGYNLYSTSVPSYRYVRVVTGTTALAYNEPFDNTARAVVYAVTAVDAHGRESGFSALFDALRLSTPSSIAIDDQNRRIVLDPQNGYALLYQSPDGRFVHTLGSVDFHLEFSSYLARDSQGLLIIAHPGDAYDPRHSVRVTDPDARSILEFGAQGAAPGQFQAPAGVAAWGRRCSALVGPYAVDAHTRLLLHFDDSYAGAQGQQAGSNGTTFTDGKYAQAVAIDATDTLTYATAGNLSRTQGAIEFWVRPSWNGDDGQSYTLFEVGHDWFNRMRIMKDGANNLRFMLWDSATEYGVGDSIASWSAGAWHHVAVTWAGTNIALYVDGELRASSNAAHPPDTLAPNITIGASSAFDQQANAAIDELRISDIPRVGNSDTCVYRFLVADSGNNRVQAFDEQGRFVSAYGGAGTGLGKFNNPQGLVVDSRGQVIVADSGNNRLQVLSFDGANFGFLQTIASGFNRPTGVAAYGTDRIIVADTGNNKVKVLDGAGTLLSTYAEPTDGRSGAFSRPRGVAGDQSANIVVADTGNGRVVTIRGALPVAPPGGVALDGPAAGVTQVGYTFTATAHPSTATIPLTYTWQATDQSAAVHTGGSSDTIVIKWQTPGRKRVTVAVANAGGTVSSTYDVAISASAPNKIYLPLARR